MAYTGKKPLANKPGEGVLFWDGEAGLSQNGKQLPRYKGGINIEGVEYELSGWPRTAQSGVKFVSLRAQRRGAWRGQQRSQAQPNGQQSAPQAQQQQQQQREPGDEAPWGDDENF